MSTLLLQDEESWKLPRQCACGQVHSPYEWETLPYIGTMDDGDGGRLELRNCTGCGSTMSIPVEESIQTARQVVVENLRLEIETWKSLGAAWERLGAPDAAKDCLRRARMIERILRKEES